MESPNISISKGWNFKSYFWAHQIRCKVSAYLLNSILDAPPHGRLVGPGKKRSFSPGHPLSSEPTSNDSTESRQIGCKRSVTNVSEDSEFTCEPQQLTTVRCMTLGPTAGLRLCTWLSHPGTIQPHSQHRAKQDSKVLLLSSAAFTPSP